MGKVTHLSGLYKGEGACVSRRVGFSKAFSGSYLFERLRSFFKAFLVESEKGTCASGRTRANPYENLRLGPCAMSYTTNNQVTKWSE
jgi:hypothetical protein